MQELNFSRIGKKIKAKRVSLGYKQEYIAERLEVNPSHISNIECGRSNPSLTTLVRIADIFQCSVDCFLHEEYTQMKDNQSDLEQRIIPLIKFKSEDELNRIIRIIELL